MIPLYSYPGPGAMRRVLRRILTPLVCGAFLLAGCSKDLAEVPADPEPPVEKTGTLNLSISVSGVSSSRPGTYSLTPEQESIVNMDEFNVLLFRADEKAAGDDQFDFVLCCHTSS